MAFVRLSGLPETPLSVIETQAEGQADCLEADACEAWAPVPAALGGESVDGEDGTDDGNGDGMEVEVRLREVDDSGVSGTATLTAAGDETVATIDLRDGEDGMLVVQGGTCNELDPRPLSDLAEYDDGEAMLVIPLALEDLLDGHAIAVFAGEDDLDEPAVACEDLSLTAG